jgi:hypothetical protein
MNRLNKIWVDIKSNYDIYLTGALAAVVAILGIFEKVSSKVISSTILVTLAMVSLNLYFSRKENKNLRSDMTNLTTKSSIIGHLFYTKYDIEAIIQQIRSSRVVYLWGTTLAAHIPLLRDEIKQGLINGLEIKILLIKPNSSAVRMAVSRAKNSNEVELNSTLESNLAILCSLAEEIPEGKLEYRVIDYLAPYTMYCFDPHYPQGDIRIMLSTFHLENFINRPRFKITRANDEQWFDYFSEQFELIWGTAELYER